MARHWRSILLIPGGVSVSRSEAELIQNMLAQVNVRVSINTVPGDNLFDKYITPGQYDMTVFSWLGTPFPISASQSIYRKPIGDKIQQNFARIGSDELDQAFDAAVQELDPQKAIALANQADTLIYEQVHSVTTYHGRISGPQRGVSLTWVPTASPASPMKRSAGLSCQAADSTFHQGGGSWRQEQICATPSRAASPLHHLQCA